MSAETYKILSLPVLKMELQSRGLNDQGKKKELIDRLVESDKERAEKGIVADEDEEEEEEEEEKVDKAGDGAKEKEGEKTEQESAIKLKLLEEEKTPDTKEAEVPKEKKTEETKKPDKDEDLMTEEDIMQPVDPAQLIPREELKEIVQALYDANVKREEGSTKTVLKAPVRQQIELKEIPHCHLRSKTFQNIINQADTYQFKFYKNRGEKGFGELALESIDKAVEVAKALRAYETQFRKDRSKQFQVKTFYGDYEKEIEVNRRKEQEMKERARRKEEDERKRAERDAERKMQEERTKDIENARKALDARSLCVINVPQNATKDIVKTMFEEAVRVELKIDQDGKCKNHAYLEFTDEETRDKCYNKYQGAVITDGEVKCAIVVKKLPLGSENQEAKPAAPVARPVDKPKVPVRAIGGRGGGGRGRASGTPSPGRRGGQSRGSQPPQRSNWNMHQQMGDGGVGMMGSPMSVAGGKRPLVGGGYGGAPKRGMRGGRRGQ